MPSNNSSFAQNPFPGPADVEGYQRLAGSCSTSEQVRLFSGNLVATISLVDVPTIGAPLSLYLVYNAQDVGFGPLGHKWRHNYMMRLLFAGDPTNQVTFVSDTGRHFGFVPDGGGGWMADGNSYFFPGTLTNPGPGWRISFPDDSFLDFNGTNGLLVGMGDAHNNVTTLFYVGDRLTSVTEPTGRHIILQYSGDFVIGVVDPNGNMTVLNYDNDQNLDVVTGPEGCVATMGYSAHLLTSSTDPLGNTYLFAYDGQERLVSVTDSETPSHVISYVYDTISESTGEFSADTFSRTRLTDARGKLWEYRFDHSGNLWKIIDPLGHVRHYRWDSEQKLLAESAAFPPGGPFGPPRDNHNNIFRRFAYDASGNLLQEADASGMLTVSTYDAKRNLTSVYPGRAHLGCAGQLGGRVRLGRFFVVRL